MKNLLMTIASRASFFGSVSGRHISGRHATRRRRRLIMILAGLSVLGVALGLILYAMRGTLVFFHSPSMVTEKSIAPGTRFRLGGLVKEGSVIRKDQNLAFDVTDNRHTLSVTYYGLVPDLFREGQGVVAEGKLDQTGVFRADTVLARHDENYMPREVADSLKAEGHWQGASQAGKSQQHNMVKP
jgi:cytochrome c-type biogenesis protein CcmE